MTIVNGDHYRWWDYTILWLFNDAFQFDVLYGRLQYRMTVNYSSFIEKLRETTKKLEMGEFKSEMEACISTECPISSVS